MISAAIFPPGKLDDKTVDEVVTAALSSGLVACNAKTGPFRICFFQPNSIPSNWARIGLVIKEESCSA